MNHVPIGVLKVIFPVGGLNATRKEVYWDRTKKQERPTRKAVKAIIADSEKKPFQAMKIYDVVFKKFIGRPLDYDNYCRELASDVLGIKLRELRADSYEAPSYEELMKEYKSLEFDLVD